MTWSLVWALLILLGGCLAIAAVCVVLIIRRGWDPWNPWDRRR